MYFESEEQKAEIVEAEDYNEEAQNNTHQKWSINKSIFELTIYESQIIKKFIGDGEITAHRKKEYGRATFAGLSAFDFQAEESKEIR